MELYKLNDAIREFPPFQSNPFFMSFPTTITITLE
jgi:hypothetical protein